MALPRSTVLLLILFLLISVLLSQDQFISPIGVTMLPSRLRILFDALCITPLVTLCASVPVLSRSESCRYPPLISATSEQLQQGLVQGCFSSVNLVDAYFGRIDDVNWTLHVVTELNPDAREIAEQLDNERKQGYVRGPLHGLPILVKGNIATADKLNTTAGSYGLLGSELPHDSTVVAKLREAGLIVLGMANLSQWANFRSTNSTNGWSAYGGQVTAAYYEHQDPSGSSSGSGVSADLGLAFAALGTETSGSIISPSEANNVVGIKPTVGLTSRHLVIPISQHQDTVGPMTRTVKDGAKLLQAIAGPDPNDNYTSANPFGSDIPDYASACVRTALNGKRIGIARNVLENDLDTTTTPIHDAFEAAVSIIEEHGATIVDNANFTAFDEFLNHPNPLVMRADLVSDMAAYLSQLKTNPNDLHILEDIREFTQSFPLEDFPYRNTEEWDDSIAAGINNTSPGFWPLYQKNLYFGGEGGILGALQRHNLDAVILPSSIGSGIPALVGSPVVTVPMGAFPDGTEVVYEETRGELVESGPGIPFGLSFLGDLWSEEGLIGMAYAYEQATLVRGELTRYIQPTTELEDMK